MIPEHDENGNLPPGIHKESFEKVIERFRGGFYLTRRSRTDNLIELYEFVRKFAIGFYINGSYITKKLAPSDVDVMIILPPDFDFESKEGRRLLRMRKNKKTNRLDNGLMWKVNIMKKL